MTSSSRRGSNSINGNAHAPKDQAARIKALDPTKSFIVQAPAGSGKTELLTQRFLTLLAGVKSPEDIVAITFTKKAAAEMRNRILDALRNAAPLAVAALKRDKELDWQILNNPQRLRIQTIDSFNAALTRQMPLLTRLGAQPAIVEDARDHFLDAARLCLEPHDNTIWGEAVKALHAHLDGDLGRARELIASMLKSRDQWIWHLAGGAKALSREALEAALDRAVRDELALVVAVFAPDDLAQALDLIQIAASNLRTSDKAGTETALSLIAAAEAAAAGLAPSTDPASLPVWWGVATLLLTGGDELRSPKGVRVDMGFPPDAANKPHKAALQELLTTLAAGSGNDSDTDFSARLARVRILPPTKYSEDHWKLLGALADLLPRAVAALETVFAATGEVDFAEVSLRALSALRDGELPTDLALSLDYRISHLLVDEFQDTSVNQMRLLERLTEGWASSIDGSGDGRTLFVVGDPMQSIYRFRKAEVALFTKAMAQGIGSVPLTTLKLTENFRSQENLVEWCNASFDELFPAQADPANGAVPFAPATAHKAGEEGEAVSIHPLFDADPAVEAELVCDLVKGALAQGHASVAILVSARSHLRAIMPALKAHGITPRVTDIEPLRERPMVRDLVALTRALLHRADRTAWLSVLRAPWCGLSLDALLKHTQQQPLDAQDQPRLSRVEAVFTAARAQHRRGTLKRLVEGAWLALGGPACARDQEDLADARAYFAFLSEHDVAGDLDDPAALDELMKELFAPPAPDADARVQVLTMHKAKGLEFDTVILPGLARLGGRDEPALLRWLDRPNTANDHELDLMMAALAATGADKDPIYAYVGELSRQQRAAEQLRQLYVASTRPKRRLHLIGQVTLAKEGVKLPRTGSLLRAMWGVVEDRFVEAAASAASPERRAEEGPPVQRFRRLPAAWTAPALPDAVAALPALDTSEDEDYIPFDWVGQTTRVVGIVVHRLLQRIAEDGLERYAEPLMDWDPEKPDAVPPEVKVDPRVAAKRATRIASLWPAAEALLVREGLADVERSKALALVKQAITNTLEDPTGRWILSPHEHAVSEHSMTVAADGRISALRIDRMLGSGTTRWVVDFKASNIEGSGVDAFLDQQVQRYRDQLRRYSSAVFATPGAPVNAALYFPQLGRLRR